MSDDNETSQEIAEEHPTADDLMGFADGTLTTQTEERVRRHVESCSECQSLVDDLSNYHDLEPPSEAYRVGEEELRATLGALRAQALASPPDDFDSRPGETPVTELQPRVIEAPLEETRSLQPADHLNRTPPYRLRWWQGLAAAAVFFVLGWALQRGDDAQRLQREVAELQGRLAAAEQQLRQPWSNVEVSRLLAGEDQLRGSSVTSISLSEAAHLVFIQTPEPLAAAQYRVEIRNSSGDVILPIAGLVPKEVGLSFFLPPGALVPGNYLLWLLRDGSEIYPTPFELRFSE